MSSEDQHRQPIDGEFPKPLLLASVAAILGACALLKYVVIPLAGGAWVVGWLMMRTIGIQ